MDAPKLIVALDFQKKRDVFEVTDKLNPSKVALKVGSELFTALGPSIVREFTNLSFKVFLDLKFHDIPNTVASACQAAADLGVWMMNVHASGGLEMMSTAKKALDGYHEDRPILLGVTVLTSMSEQQLRETGVQRSPEEQVLALTKACHQAGLDGVVCSAHEANIVKDHTKKPFLRVTPGIRPKGTDHQDQTRVMTPGQAMSQGSDYIVVGRPITQSKHPESVVDAILSEIQAVVI